MRSSIQVGEGEVATRALGMWFAASINSDGTSFACVGWTHTWEAWRNARCTSGGGRLRLILVVSVPEGETAGATRMKRSVNKAKLRQARGPCGLMNPYLGNRSAFNALRCGGSRTCTIRVWSLISIDSRCAVRPKTERVSVGCIDRRGAYVDSYVVVAPRCTCARSRVSRRMTAAGCV